MNEKHKQFIQIIDEWEKLDRPTRELVEAKTIVNKHCANCEYYQHTICHACGYIVCKDPQKKNNLLYKGNFACPDNKWEIMPEIKNKILPKDWLSLGLRYLREQKVWKDAGMPLRGQELIEYIYNEICLKCKYFNIKKQKCTICGCYINTTNQWNKLAWKTTKCPFKPPKWIQDTRVPENYKKEKPPKKVHKQESSSQPKPIPRRRSCCG